MEVHHHSHTSSLPAGKAGKKWTHYLWEFLMLFLAVFCGFLAEYQLEHVIENKKEKQYINSLLEDLKSDTAYFEHNIKLNTINQQRIDSLLIQLKYYNPKIAANEIYSLAMAINSRGNRLQYVSRTFEQLKSSGGLRLIKNHIVLDSVSDYYESMKWIDVQNQLRIDRQHDLILTHSEIFDAWVLNEQAYKTDTMLHLLSTDKKLLNTYATRLFHFKGVDLFLLNRVKDSCLPRAKSLINLIKNEYHLK